MLKRYCLVCVMLLLMPSAQAQGTSANGSVAGHVLCADTQRPARTAHVILQPVIDLKSPVLHRVKGQSASEGNIALTPTSLDGSFVIANVPPGRYYVIAEQDGYVSPLSLFTRDELNHPDEATAARIPQYLTMVAVTAGHTTQAEVRLVRGGVISGTVHFDDGAPAVHVRVELLHKDKEGKWVAARYKPLGAGFGEQTTDDRGDYRISGLGEGDYLVKASIVHDNLMLDHVFEAQGSMYMGSDYSLAFFPGDITRPKDAKAVHVDEGADAAGNDIDIPVSKLYTVSGTVLQAGTAHSINAAHVALNYADDNTELTSTEVSKEDGQFHFPFVPAGSFVLKVTGVRDVSRTEVPTCEHCMPPTHTEEKTLRTYGDVTQPLMVEGDLNAVTVNISGPSAGGTP